MRKCFVLLFLLGCRFENNRENISKPVVSNIQSLKNKLATIDSLFALAQKNKEGYKIKLFYKTGKIVRPVKDTTQWPVNYDEIINLLVDGKGLPLLYKELPFIESEDGEVSYSYYFDKKGNVFAIDVWSWQFDNPCKDDKELTLQETRTSFYNTHHEKINEIYSLKDKKGNLIDSTFCTYNGYTSHSIYNKFSDTPIYKIVH